MILGIDLVIEGAMAILFTLFHNQKEVLQPIQALSTIVL